MGRCDRDKSCGSYPKGGEKTLWKLQEGEGEGEGPEVEGEVLLPLPAGDDILLMRPRGST